MPRQILMNLAKPVWAAFAACILILVVGIGGVYASKNAKPGDSLYIAKIISERAQFAITFDEKDKAKLGIEFAANRAKEMIQVLKDSGQTAVASDQLKTLTQNFKKEISQVKKRLTTIKAAENQSKNDDSEVFGANLGKSNQRMEIAEPIKPQDDAVKASTSKPVLIENKALDKATSTQTLENQIPAGATSTPEIISQADKMLEQAEKLFDEKNLDGTIGALEEVNKAIGDKGQVKGESETASSTKGD